jgi:hypothetical protein
VQSVSLTNSFPPSKPMAGGDHDGVLLWWKVSTLNCDWYSLES